MKTLKLIIGFLIGMIVMPSVYAQGHHNRDYYERDYLQRDKYKKRDHYERSYRYDRLSIESLEIKIERAARRGQLTGRELRKLENELFELKKLERKVYRNNHVSQHERIRLEDEKRDLDRRIDQYIHNCRTW
ncbi:MAG: hypothetical protein IPH57_00940 [Saprospiraceae bacterium]|nr:hypothetical protein [Saprospiraceae bacterium]